MSSARHPSRRATSTSRAVLDELAEPTTSMRSHRWAIRAHGVLAVLGGVADVVGGRAHEVGEPRRRAAIDRRPSRRWQASSGSGTTTGRLDEARGRARATSSVRCTSGCGPGPHRGCRPPLRARHGRSRRSGSLRQRNAAPRVCTLATRGQVASITFRSCRFGCLRRTAGETPWAARTTWRRRAPRRAPRRTRPLWPRGRPRRAGCGRSGGAR